MKSRSAITISLATMCAATLIGNAAEARVYEVLLKSSDVVLTTINHDASVVMVDLPGTLEKLRVDYATIEFYLESDNSESTYFVTFGAADGFSKGDTTYTIVTDAMTGRAGINKGSSQRVLMDITSVVKTWKGLSGVDYGVFYKGSAGSDRTLTLKSDNFGSNVIARIEVYATDR